MKIKATEMVELQYYARENYGSMPFLCVRNSPPTDARNRHDVRVWNPRTETVDIACTELVEHLPDCTGWDWKPDYAGPKYRQFAGPKELMPILAEKPWVQLKASATEDYELITTVNLIGVFFGARTATVTLWDELFRRYQFVDGTPCGVPVEE